MITITAALNRLIEMADVIDVSATCGCWVTQPGAYWEGRRLCECECDCECHGESDVIIRLTDQNRALAKALLGLSGGVACPAPAPRRLLFSSLAWLAIIGLAKLAVWIARIWPW